jgi:peptide deformylase
MIQPILQLGNSILRKKSLSIKDFNNKDIKNIITDLSDTLNEAQRKFNYGRGIAAPQIGILKRIIYINMPGFKSEIINPKILKTAKKTFEVWDSCFSFNVSFFVLVDRHYSIDVEYFDYDGKRHKMKVENQLSELLEHEIDHLDGILAIDRMKNKKIVMRPELK